MAVPKISSILVVDPTSSLGTPYTLLPTANITHVTATPQATQYLHDQTPDLVIVSASYSPHQMVQLMEALKEAVSHRLFLIPLIVMIDLDNRINFVPGTRWGQKFGVLCTLSTKEEVETVLARVCTEQKTLGYE